VLSSVWNSDQVLSSVWNSDQMLSSVWNSDQMLSSVWNSDQVLSSVWNSDQVLSSVWSVIATFGCHKDHITRYNLGAGEVIITVIMKTLPDLGNFKLHSFGLLQW
jgi:hypothetical protein